MALERPQPFSALDVPEHHLTVSTCADDLAVLKPNSIYRTFMSTHGAMQLQRRSVPYSDDGILGTEPVRA